MDGYANSLAGAFLGQLGPGAAGGWSALPTLDDDLRRVYLAGRAAWPGVDLPGEAYVRHLAARWPEAAPPDGSFAALRSQDLYLACACLHEQPAAIAAFERCYLAPMTQVLAHLRPSRELVDEVRQQLRHKLFTRSPAAPPKIADYAGRGTLAVWVRAAAVRIGLTLLKAAGRELRAGDEDTLLAQAAAGSGPLASVNPELAYIKGRDRQAVKAAFRSALSLLDPGQRNLLRLHYLDGLSLAEIGVLQGVHKTTILRRLTRVEETIAAEMRHFLGANLRIPPAEVDSLIELVLSQLGQSLAGLVGEVPGESCT